VEDANGLSAGGGGGGGGDPESKEDEEGLSVAGGGGGGGGAKERLAGCASREPLAGALALLFFLAAAAANLAISRDDREALLLSRYSQAPRPTKRRARPIAPLVSIPSKGKRAFAIDCTSAKATPDKATEKITTRPLVRILDVLH